MLMMMVKETRKKRRKPTSFQSLRGGSTVTRVSIDSFELPLNPYLITRVFKMTAMINAKAEVALQNC